MERFDDATAVRRTGPGSFAADVDPDWWVFTGPNGGYVASVLLRALTDAVGDPARPARSLTVHYPRPSVAGPAEIDVAEVRAGKSLSFLATRMRQGGEVVATGSAVFGSGRGEPVCFQDPVIDGVPHVATVPLPDVPDEMRPPIARRFDYKPTVERAPFSGTASEFWCWIRPVQPRPVDALLLATYADAFVPAVFFRATRPLVAPTIDLTVHFRQAPADGYDGWCLGHVSTRTAAEGFIEEDVEIFDDSGRLLAQSRQLALLLPLD